MEIYELKDGCQLKQIQKIYKLEIFGQVVEDISYDTKIITDGFIDSNNDISEIYDYYSKNDIVRTTNLYLKNILMLLFYILDVNHFIMVKWEALLIALKILHYI